MMLTIAMIVGIGVLGLVWAKFRPQRNTRRTQIAAGVLVIAVTAPRLFSEPPGSGSFVLYAVLIAVMLVAIGVHLRRLRSA